MTDGPIIHLAYAEDQTMVRKGIISLLENMGGLAVDIEAENGKDLLRQVASAKDLPDVCLLDINMPEMDGFDTLVELKKKWPEIKVLILSVFEMPHYITKMLALGANGYLLKKGNPAEIKKAIVMAYNTGYYYSDLITREFVSDVKKKMIRIPHLTASELQVIKYACTNLTYGEMAAKMHCSQRSVDGFRDSIFAKLDIHNRAALVMFAVQAGIVSVEINESGGKRNFR